MTVSIHPTSIVSKEARLGENVEIGPFCIVGPQVTLGNDCKLFSHVILEGNTTIGKNNKFFQFCSIGAAPQDNSYKGEDTKVIIGDNNTFRESVTVHRATTKEDYKTIIGSNSLFMAYTHIAHDCIIGDKVTFVNSCNLAGHVHIGDRVIIGGSSCISQFVTLGRGAYIGGASALDKDIPPFCTALGNRIKLKGINIIGMRRQGFERNIITEVIEFYRSMESSPYSARTFVERPEIMDVYKDNPIVKEMADFIYKSEVGIAPFMNS
jgi:UDP-N-acetylglucosamine acyltransferase